MGKYVTISVPNDIKIILEKAKGKEEWGKFLLNLYIEAKSSKRKIAFAELTNMLNERDFEAITKSSKEFREKFTFR